MAKILITGPYAQIELTQQDEDVSEVTATCIDHSTSDGRLAPPGNCSWVMHFSSFEAAICTPFAEDHADTGRMDA